MLKLKRKHSDHIARNVAFRLDQRGIPAAGLDGQVLVYSEASKDGRVLLSLQQRGGGGSGTEWYGFWFWAVWKKIPVQYTFTFDLPSEFKYGYNDPLSVEIAFLEWVESCDYQASDGVFRGEPDLKGENAYYNGSDMYPMFLEL